jgi:hypothetical protein
MNHFSPFGGVCGYIGKYRANLERKRNELFSKKNVKRAK